VQFKDDDAGVEGDTSYKAGERGEGGRAPRDDLLVELDLREDVREELERREEARRARHEREAKPFCFRPRVALGPPRQFTEGRGRSRACNL